MEYFYELDQIQPLQRHEVGDKAFYLGLCKQRGYPIAPGLVVSASAWRRFLETIQWVEPWFADLPNSSLHIDVDNPRQLQAIAQQIHQGIEATPISDAWLDQIEATAQSWQTNFLRLQPSIAVKLADRRITWKTAALLQNQRCEVERGAIAQGLRQVWKELFRAKSLLYWQRLGIQLQQIDVAVLIQPLESAIASGTVQIDAAYLEVQSIWGMGDALAEGIVTADMYHLDRETGLLRSATPGIKRYSYGVDEASMTAVEGIALPLFPSPSGLKLYAVASAQQHQSSVSDRQLQQIVQMARRLAQQWGQPLELEWMIAQPPPSAANAISVLEPTLYLTQLFPGSVQLAMSAYTSTAVKLESLRVEGAIAPIDQLQGEILGNSLNKKVDQPPPPAVDLLPEAILVGAAASGGQVVAHAWVVDDLRNLSQAPANAVLVTSHIQPQWVAALSAFAAIVTEQGGATSHGAILAREMGIPAVVGVVNVRQQIQSGDVVFVDGDRGWVCRVQGEQMDLSSDLIGSTVAENRASMAEMATEVGTEAIKINLAVQTQATHTETVHTLAIHAEPVEVEIACPLIAERVADSIGDGAASSHPMRAIATQLMVNMSQTSSLAQVAAMSVDGVGLLRSELMLRKLLQEHRQPHPWQQSNTELIKQFAEQIQQFANAFAPRPVFYRSLDLRSHEVTSTSSAVSEANPTLGLHGTFSYQVDPSLFDLELAALRRIQQQGANNVHLMLPFVRTVEEFEFCRDRVIRSGLTQNPQFQLWIMAEVPSVLFLIPDYVKAGVQGISIGSNDLTQLLLAVDRDHPQMNTAFDQRHPSVLRAIQHLIQSARQAGIPCSICGQLPVQHPDVIELLVKWGITSISVSPDAVEKTYRAIAQAEQVLRG